MEVKLRAHLDPLGYSQAMLTKYFRFSLRLISRLKPGRNLFPG